MNSKPQGIKWFNIPLRHQINDDAPPTSMGYIEDLYVGSLDHASMVWDN